LDRSFLETLVIDHGRQTVEAFLDRHAARLELKGNGLAPALTSWLQRDETFDAVWNFAFGDIYSALVSDQPDEVDRSAAALAIRLHAFGLEGEWQFEVDQPAGFLFDRWLLPLSDAVRVSATGGCVSIDTRTADGWRQTTFRRGENGWDSSNGRSLPVLGHPGLRCTVLPIECLPPTSSARKLAAGSYDADNPNTDTDLLLRTGDEAAKLIAEFADVYLPWVSQVVKDLVPLPPKPDTINSASGNLAPGVITVTNQERRCTLAEQLVHEATHHYLYIIKRLGPIDDGSDQTLYFSPFRNVGRPILYILFAYHAFGNVLLFYRMAQANGLPDYEPGMYSTRRLEEHLHALEKALETTRALTPLGRALWERLHDQIHR
jgi:HEXXH motif-containing protein